MFRTGDRVELRRFKNGDPALVLNYTLKLGVFPPDKSMTITGVVKDSLIITVNPRDGRFLLEGEGNDDIQTILVDFSDFGGPKNWYCWLGALTLIPSTSIKDWL